MTIWTGLYFILRLKVLIDKDAHVGIVSFCKAPDAALHGILISEMYLLAKST